MNAEYSLSEQQTIQEAPSLNRYSALDISGVFIPSSASSVSGERAESLSISVRADSTYGEKREILLLSKATSDLPFTVSERILHTPAQARGPPLKNSSS